MLEKELNLWINKNWKINIIIQKNWTIEELSANIATKSENCSIEEVYKKWIGTSSLHLPFWICLELFQEFPQKFNVDIEKDIINIKTVNDFILKIEQKMSKYQKIKVKIKNFIRNNIWMF